MSFSLESSLRLSQCVDEDVSLGRSNKNVQHDSFYYDADFDRKRQKRQSRVTETSCTTALSDVSIGRLETRRLWHIRRFFISVLFLSTVGIAFAIFNSVRKNQIVSFEAQFNYAATKIIDTFHASVKQKLGALEALSIATTSHATRIGDSRSNISASENDVWPFVTIPDFAILGASTRTLGESVAITFHPLVHSDKREQWEEYVLNNLQWINEGLNFEQNWIQNHSALLTSTKQEIRRLRGQHQMLQRQTTEGDTGHENKRDMSEQVVTDNILARSNTYNISTNIYNLHVNDKVISPPKDYYLPMWLSSPVETNLVNFDLSSNPDVLQAIEHVWTNRRPLIGNIADEGSDLERSFRNHWVETWKTTHLDPNFTIHPDEPVSKLYVPVFDKLVKGDDKKKEHVELVGFYVAVFFWESYLTGVLSPHTPGIITVLHNDCGQDYTYQVNGETVEYLVQGDIHNSEFDHLQAIATLTESKGMDESIDSYGDTTVDDICNIVLQIYPTKEFQKEHLTYLPWLLLGLVIFIFFCTTLIIAWYEYSVQERQELVAEKAAEAGAIVSSIYPAVVRQHLYTPDVREEDSNIPAPFNFRPKVPNFVDEQKNKIKNLLEKGTTTTAPMERSNSIASNIGVSTPPPNDRTNLKMAIVDNFPNVTIMFGDIVGFKPWSSQREPSEIFQLLQTLYQTFDSVAEKMNVFKVETVGDCYVAAAGIPDPQNDHAVRMVRFSRLCLEKMVQVTQDLETTLGPDTGELRMRIGLHSGPVTAGVLRCGISRYQLFGDTMNMASRMQSKCHANKIQCSEATAELLRKDGKDTWIRPRKDVVEAKGKGRVQTYWISPQREKAPDSTTSTTEGLAATTTITTEDNVDNSNNDGTSVQTSAERRKQRLVDWNVETLSHYLKKIAAKRQNAQNKEKKKKKDAPSMELKPGSSALAEVSEIITLPQEELLLDCTQKSSNTIDTSRSELIQLDPQVSAQLRDYVTTIAYMYHDNAFHNFEHASHVTMCTNKLLKRIILRDVDYGMGHVDSMVDSEDDFEKAAINLHDYTMGIRSDPITQFALLFCALVHDVDHSGVPNHQLVVENVTIARIYKKKSIAEQNSIDLAWDLLSDPSYDDLRNTIYANEKEMKQFRQLIVNIILATDIFDKDLKSIREKRWNKAFQYDDTTEGEDDEEVPTRPSLKRSMSLRFKKGNARLSARTPLSHTEGLNLKATIVMEHLIQASDVAHTMQHWEVYLKWNERLFQEMYFAYEAGRSSSDPSKGWYVGEILFFDKYIIPLAQKLHACGVFGVSSDECLSYAVQNRKMWALEGEQMVEEYKQRCQRTPSKRKDIARIGSKMFLF